MKCNICNKDMSDKEIVYSDDLKTYEPCTTCLDIAMDAAYSQGFLTEDDEYVIINDGDDDAPTYSKEFSLYD